jgi:shikimate O-hydroxycinnamoyltransferase
LFRLTKEEVEKLKKKANDCDLPKDSRPYSRFEAICAHIWRSASKARELEENQQNVVRFNVEIRNRMIPNLPKNFYGNALIQTTAKEYVGEMTSKPLSYVAMKIREAHKMITDEYIRSHIDVIRSFENMDDARKLFINAFVGNPNLHITSWLGLPECTADFGWGNPIYFGLAYVISQERGLIYMNPNGDGSVTVLMYLQDAVLPLFNKFFYEDLYELITSSAAPL